MDHNLLIHIVGIKMKTLFWVIFTIISVYLATVSANDCTQECATTDDCGTSAGAECVFCDNGQGGWGAV